MKTVFTTGEAAEICKVSQQTIIRCFDSGRLKGFRVPGSRFRRIPRDALIAFMRDNGIPPDSLDSGKSKVLVVDDDPEIVELFVDVLERDGRFEVKTASTGYDAGMLTTEFMPDLIILDYMLPDINGNIVCKTIRQNPNFEHTKIVIVSGVVACAFAVTKRQLTVEAGRLREKLVEAEKAADKAAELERVRIASDFHDGPLQSFISLQMRLEILRKVMDRDLNAGMTDLKQLQALAQSQVRDLRTFLHSMRPVDVDGANLVATARRAAESFQKESGIPVTFLGPNAPVGLPSEMTLEVLQMVREALHNVQKHAGATRVAVAMETTDRGLEISVDDNGHGFGFAGAYSLEELELLRLGPASLKRRARSLNADLLLESKPGRGSGIKFRIPL